MFEQTIETSGTPHVTIAECSGSLKITGSEEQRVAIRAEGEARDVTLEQTGETFTLASEVDCALTCPRDTTLTIHRVDRNLRVRGVRGPIAIKDVCGNAKLRGVGPTTLEQSHGNLGAQRLSGELRVQRVGGNARVRRVEGLCSLNHVGGNLRAQRLEGDLLSQVVRGNARISQVGGACSLDRVDGNLSAQRVEGDLSSQAVRGNANISQVGGACSLDHVYGNLSATELQGGLTIAEVGGNARLTPSFAPGAIYHLNAKGNLDIHLPDEANVRLILRAGRGVRSHIQGLALEDADGQTTGVLGTGDANLKAQAAGRIHLRPAAQAGARTHDRTFISFADSDDLSATIQAHVDETVAEIQSRVMEGLRSVDGERIQQQIDRAGERARRSAGREAEKTRRRAEREAERARLRQERAERRWRRVSGQRPQPKREATTGEEQMHVLRMVEEGKLTPEQAADLLDALEGR